MIDMKNLATILSVFSIVVLITACEKSPEVPEVEFNLPLIPGQYKGDTEVMGTQFNFIRRIPESFHKDNKGYITEINNCTLTADKGYLFKPYQMDLFHSRQINLKTPMRFNQHVKESFPIIIDFHGIN